MADDTVGEPSRSNSPIEEIPACDICFDTFHSTQRPPKNFPCGHYFCEGCIANIYRTLPFPTITGVPCPTCREPARIKNGLRPMDTFAPNFFLNEFLEKHEKQPDNNKTYECMHCSIECHEKRLTSCTMCEPVSCTRAQTFDFMNRASNSLICASCAELFHTRHYYMPIETVTNKWNNRELFGQFTMSAKAEDDRLDRIIEEFQKGIDVAKTQKLNIMETVCQFEANIGNSDISKFLKKYVDSGRRTSRLLRSVEHSARRFSDPNEWKFRSVDEMFRSELATDDHVMDTEKYREELSKLFAENSEDGDGSDARGDIQVDQDTMLVPVLHGINQPNPLSMLLENVIERMATIETPNVDVTPHIPLSFANLLHRQPVLHYIGLRDAANYLPVPFQPMYPSPVTPFTYSQRETILNYYYFLSAEDQRAFARRLCSVPDIAALERARQEALSEASHSFPPYRRSVPLTLYFKLPFHLFNPHLPGLYVNTLESVIKSFASYSFPHEEEVFGFFSLPRPLRAGQYNREAYEAIKKVIYCIMMFVEQEQAVHTTLRDMMHELERLMIEVRFEGVLGNLSGDRVLNRADDRDEEEVRDGGDRQEEVQQNDQVLAEYPVVHARYEAVEEDEEEDQEDEDEDQEDEEEDQEDEDEDQEDEDDDQDDEDEDQEDEDDDMEHRVERMRAPIVETSPDVVFIGYVPAPVRLVRPAGQPFGQSVRPTEGSMRRTRDAKRHAETELAGCTKVEKHPRTS